MLLLPLCAALGRAAAAAAAAAAAMAITKVCD